MLKKIATLLIAAAITVSTVACSGTETVTSSDTTESSQSAEVSESTEEKTEEVVEETEVTDTSETEETSDSVTLGLVDDTLAEDEEALIDTYAELFDQLTYTDEETGLTITYNLYLPEGYDESEEYPMVVFIGDSTTAGTDAEYSLTQGLGGIVWASSEWQSVYPTIVAVPTYPETILDDQNGYSTTEYVELTARFIEYMTEEYSVDTDRIYGTGQSMGCMTTLILASEYPDLFAGCMFVDGQWDVSTLESLEGQTFVYFAAEDDTSAWTGMQEVMSMFDEDGVEYAYAQWDGTWSADELSSAAEELFSSESSGAYFISWASGTIDASTANSAMGAGGGMKMQSDSEDSAGSEMSLDESFDAADSESSSMGMKADGEMSGRAGGGNGGNGDASGIAGSVSYHMASFDYAYNCIAVMEWLFQQTNE